MPWIGIYEGEKKGPWQVPLRSDVKCPTCEGRMRVWRESSDGRARHFKHIDGMGHSEGGGGAPNCETVAESDKHLKWKSLAAQRLATVFDVPDDEVQVEMPLAAPTSSKERRVADTAVVFPEPDPELGKGLAVEVQHKNESKDIEETARDYISQDFSIVWTDERDYAEDHCKLTEIDIRARARDAAWPDHVPPTDEWRDDKHDYRNSKARWIAAYKSGLTQQGSDATLPPDWFDDQAMEIWRAQDWMSLFRCQDAFGRYESENYIRELRRMLGAAEVSATLPTDFFDELILFIWNWASWEDRFDPSDSDTYRLQAAIPRVHASTNSKITLSPNCVDTIQYRNSEWDGLFHNPVYGNQSADPVEIEVDFAPFFSENFWKHAYENGRDKIREQAKNLSKPPTLFDDVQCHSCGHYQYWKTATDACPNCGEKYDWGWNIRSGRISRESVPDGMDFRY